MRLAIIDIGSNSMRLVIYEIINKSYKIIGQLKHSVRLGEDMKQGMLKKNKILYSLDVIKDFNRYLKSKNVDTIVPIATEAIRKAKNKDDFLIPAEKILDKKIKILEGQEEAYYDYFAVINTIDLSDFLMIDIGGSSTEIGLVKNKTLVESISLAFGSITLTEKFDLKNNPENSKPMDSYLKKIYTNISWIDKAYKLPIVGIGGSVRTLSKIDRYRKDQATLIAHNYSLNKHDVKVVDSMVKSYLKGSKKRIYGLHRDREDIFVGSLAAITVLMKQLNNFKIFVSNCGVREGILFEEMFGDKIVEDVLEFSLNNIINLHMYKDYEGKDLFKIVEPLYNNLSNVFPILQGNWKVLKSASYLFDLGTSINYFQRDRNTFYSILNSPINGLSQKQILMAASTASVFSAHDILKEFFNKKMLGRKDLKVIEMLGILLKLGEAINLGVSGETFVRKIDIVDTNINIYCKTKHNPNFKLKEINNYKSRFRYLYKLNLNVIF